MLCRTIVFASLIASAAAAPAPMKATTAAKVSDQMSKSDVVGTDSAGLAPKMGGQDGAGTPPDSFGDFGSGTDLDDMQGPQQGSAIAELVLKKQNAALAQISVQAAKSCKAAGNYQKNVCGSFQCVKFLGGPNCDNCGTFGNQDCGFNEAFVAQCKLSAECQSVPDPFPTPLPPPNNNAGKSDCFAKETSTACLFASPAAECKRVLMADLAVGDLVLGREGATAVVAVQHKAIDMTAKMLTFHTPKGAVSMTPDHAVFVDGKLVAAAEVKVGSLLSTGAFKHITKSEGAIINAVTADGTIVADGILAASNPMWITSFTVDAPISHHARGCQRGPIRRGRRRHGRGRLRLCPCQDRGHDRRGRRRDPFSRKASS